MLILACQIEAYLRKILTEITDCAFHLGIWLEGEGDQWLAVV